MSAKFAIAETRRFLKTLKNPSVQALYQHIRDVIYPVLSGNPYFGPQMKRLKGDYAGVYRYRIGDYRLFYSIDEKLKTVFILDFAHRQGAYQ